MITRGYLLTTIGGALALGLAGALLGTYEPWRTAICAGAISLGIELARWGRRSTK